MCGLGGSEHTSDDIDWEMAERLGLKRSLPEAEAEPDSDASPMASGGAVKTKGRVTLTPEMRELCRQQGISEVEYARNMVRMQRAREE